MTRPDDLPLSFGQQQLWLLDQIHLVGNAYSLPLCWRLNGDLNPAVLQASLIGLVERHQILRTRYESRDDVVRQVIDAPGRPDWDAVDLCMIAATERETRWQHLAAEEVRRPFDLRRRWPLRARLFRLSSHEHVFMVTVHHIACDGWSIGVLNRDLAELYRAGIAGEEPNLPQLPIQYAGFARRQRDTLTGPRIARDLDYWKATLAELEQAELPADRPRPATTDPDGASVRFSIPPQISQKLIGEGRTQGATPYMSLLSAFFVLLARWTGQPQVAVGTPLAGRASPDVRDLIGQFVNTAVIGAEVDSRLSFQKVLRSVRQACLAAYAHQEAPYERVVEKVAPVRELTRNPLFQIMFSVIGSERGSLELPGLDAIELDAPDVSPMFDLSVELTERPDAGYAGVLAYSAALFEPESMQRFAEAFQRLVSAAVAAPGIAVGDLDLLGDQARQLMRTWNQTSTPRPAVGVHDLFAQQARRTPNAPAVISSAGQLTYAELNSQANGLAQHLRKLGAGPEARIGVCLPRGLDLIVGLLAVLKAGGAYVPLDPSRPAERTALMLTDAAITLVLADQRLADRFAPAQVVSPRDAQPAGADPATTAPDSALYVLYTSGSTGTPKGVLITHRGMVNRALWGAEQHLTAGDRVLHKTPLSFDAAGWEIWAPLLAGAAVVLAEPEAERDPAALTLDIRRHAATVVQLVPSMLRLLVDEPGFADCRSLRSIFSGGEPLSAELAEQVSDVLTVDLINLYGPTECTIDVTSWHYRRGTRIAIGAPLPNVEIHVLDEELHPVPVGAAGELCVAGHGLARGYLGRVALTADRFVPDPFGSGGRLYRTGDRGRWRSDGTVEFLGRLDDQVKIGGVRIELGEVEAVLAGHPAVTGVAAVALTDGHGDRYLVAHYEPATVEADDLRTYAESRLPAALVPSTFLASTKLPRTASGKVDRPMLATSKPPTEVGDVQASTVIEKKVAAILADALGLPRIGLHDDFFRLGGHSLLAIRTASTLRRELAVELPARILFEASTVERIVRRLESPVAQQPTLARVAPAVAPPASSGQQRIWFLDQLRPGASDYLLGLAVRIRGALDVRALTDAVQGVIARHEVLRTRFELTDGVLLQVIGPPQAVQLERSRLTLASEDDLMRFIERAARVPFVLNSEAPLRATLAELGDADHLLLLVLNHIACDARSMEVLAEDLADLYAHRELPPLPARFADFAVWEREWLGSAEAAQQLSFWRAELAGLTPLELASGQQPTGVVEDDRGGLVEFTVPAAQATALVQVGRQEGATPFLTMLAAFEIALSRLTGRDDFAVGTTVAGRSHPSVERLVGPFMNSVVLRARLAGCVTFIDILRQVQGCAQRAFANQELPFDQLVGQLHPHRDAGRNPLFGVLFELEPYAGPTISLDGLEVEEIPVRTAAAKLDLTLHLDEQEDGSYHASIEYSRQLLAEHRVQEIAGLFLQAVEHGAADPQRPLTIAPASAPSEAPDGWLAAGDEHDPPETPTEETVADIWMEVLDLDQVGVLDNFFDLGGHSLLAIQSQAIIQDEFDIDLPLRVLFEAVTVRELATIIDALSKAGAEPGSGSPQPLADQVATKGELHD